MLPLLLAACTTPETPAPTPGILILTVDTLRSDRFGFAGHADAHTPELDALAARGRWFSQATTPLPRTTPALASLQTGLWPHHHGSREVGRPLQHGRTLAEALTEAGWRTIGLSAMRVAGPDQNMDRGYGTFEVHHDVRAGVLSARALELLEQQPVGPEFVWVHYSDPHFPYEPAADQPDVPEAPACRKLMRDVRKKRIRRPAIYANRDGRGETALADCVKLYDAEITAVDTAIGTLVDAWTKRHGDAGWIVVSADHGEQGLFYEHGPNVHDASLTIPLIFAGPGVVAGREDAVGRLEDVHPTLLDLAGLPATPNTDGVSLRDRLAGKEGGPDVAVAESASALHAILFDALLSGRKSLTCVNGERFSLCDRKGKEHLYDHVADPDLRKDVASEHPDVVEQLRAAKARWPPESARERTARSATHKLVKRPRLEGGYSTALYVLPDDTTDVAADHPETVAELEKALEDWGAPMPEQAERSDGEVEALRSLGYVE